jgi:type IV secretion system protein VirB4
MDLLQWATYIDENMVICKDGILISGYYFRPPDIQSATESERNYTTQVVNATLARLGEGYNINVDCVRFPSAEYPDPDSSFFGSPILEAIDNERRQQFMGEGNHFESYYVLIVSYTPPLLRQSKFVDLMYSRTAEPNKTADKIIAGFKKTLGDIQSSLSTVMNIHQMKSYPWIDRGGREHLRDELVNYLHFALTGLDHPINIPPVAMHTCGYIGGQELWVGPTPKIGENFIVAISLEGFPAQSHPNMLHVLESMAIAYRWSSRLSLMDQHQALPVLKRFRSSWNQKTRGFLSQIFKIPGGIVNEDAVNMVHEAEAAINEAHSATVGFGYYTSVILLMGPEVETLLDNARTLIREIQRDGFTCRLETMNSVEAWLGSLPGHPHLNVRRTIMHTMNFADLLPLSSTWTGHKFAPCDKFPYESPALLYASSNGRTPFRFNLHVGDVGHTCILGPTGAGKSTFNGLVAGQFTRYPGATVFVFDKGNSMWALANACGGTHYEIAAEGSPNFAPLSVLESESDISWAEEWLANCYELQSQKAPTPKQRQAIHQGLMVLKENAPKDARSLTDFLSCVQDLEIRDALKFYTMDGSLGRLLDSSEDGLQTSSFTVLEIEELMAMGEKAAIPVLLYLFRRFEKSLKGQPALLLLDEAWIMLGHPVFREKIREWLKVLRKANCSVVMATQSLSDAVKSGIFDVIIESCPTKILLPNEEADKGGTENYPGPKDLYTIMGLNEIEIRTLKNATKKHHYYYVSSEGKRLFELSLGPLVLCFVAVSDKATVSHLKGLKEVHGDKWPKVWMKERGVNYETLLAR